MVKEHFIRISIEELRQRPNDLELTIKHQVKISSALELPNHNCKVNFVWSEFYYSSISEKTYSISEGDKMMAGIRTRYEITHKVIHLSMEIL